jgi:hypothetical protein
MPDICADEPEACVPERIVFADGEGSAPSADGTPPAYRRFEITSRVRKRRADAAQRDHNPRPQRRRCGDHSVQLARRACEEIHVQAERKDHDEEDAPRMRRQSGLQPSCTPSDAARAAHVRASREVPWKGHASRLAQRRRWLASHVR